jgi:hypothetical protein
MAEGGGLGLNGGKLLGQAVGEDGQFDEQLQMFGRVPQTFGEG